MASAPWDVDDELVLINARRDGFGWGEMGHLFTDKQDRYPKTYWRHYRSLWDRYHNGNLKPGPVLDALAWVDPNTGKACPEPGSEPHIRRGRRKPQEGAIRRPANASGQGDGGAAAASASRERALQHPNIDDRVAPSYPTATCGPPQVARTNQLQDVEHDRAIWPPEDDLVLVSARHRGTPYTDLGSLFNVKRNMRATAYRNRYRVLRNRYMNAVLTAGPIYDELARYYGSAAEASPSGPNDDSGDIPSSTAGRGESNRDQSEYAFSSTAAATDRPAAQNDLSPDTATIGAIEDLNGRYTLRSATSPTTKEDNSEEVDWPEQSLTIGSEQLTSATLSSPSLKSATQHRDSVLQQPHPDPTEEMASPAPAPGINGTSTPPNLRGTPPTTQTSATLDGSSAPAASSSSAAAGAGPAISTADDGMSKRPKDYRLMHTVLAAHGVQAYEERVPLMLLDFAYRYTRGVLNDALALSADGYGAASGSSSSNARGGAGGAGAAGAAGAGGAGAAGEGTVSLPQLRVAVASRQDHQFAEPLPKNYMLELAQEVNRVALPKPDRRFGLRLPPEQYCFTGVGFGLNEEWEDDVAPEDGQSGHAEAGVGTGVGAGGDKGDETMRDEEEGADEEEDEFEEVMGVGEDKEMADA